MRRLTLTHLLALSITGLALPAVAVEGGPDAPPSAAPAPAVAVAPASTATAAAAEKPVEPTETPEPAAQARRIDDQSAELEAMRAAEQAARVQEVASAEARLDEAVEAFGPGSPLRERLSAALGRPSAPMAAEARGRMPLIPELDFDEAQLKAEYDIPIDVNESVVQYIRFFQAPLVRPHFVKWLGRSHRYLDVYRSILREEGLPEDTVYLAMIESGFANFAYSRAKAVGPWQFIAPTGKLFGLKQDFWVDERRDPVKSAKAAARYLKELHGQTGDWRLSWAGYNAGVGVIYHAQAKGYVPKLMAAAIISKHPEAFGFSHDEIEPERWPDYVEVEIPGATLLGVVARAASVDERTLVDLNPELRRTLTPPRPYQLKLPREAAETFAERWPQLAPTARAVFEGHVVKKGETMGAIASRYGVTVQEVEAMNPGVAVARLRPGTELMIPKYGGAGDRAGGAQKAPPDPPLAPAQPHPAGPALATVPTAVSPATASQAAAAPATRPDSWRVQPGDTLWSIAKHVGLELAELCRLNGIADARHHKLQVGALLKLVPQG